MDKVKNLSEFEELIGSEVKLVTDEGVYTGVVCFHDADQQSILIENGRLNASGGQTVRFPNALSFRYHEIKHYEVVTRKYNPSTSKMKVSTPLQKDHHVVTAVLKESCSPQATGIAKSKGERLLKSGFQFANKIPPQARMKNSTEPEMYLLIDQISQVPEAFDMIRSEHTIGCGFDGLHLGKHGLLCWIEIATTKYVFLFDMLNLSVDKSFMTNLKSVLEMEDIVKVIHDCRHAARLFRHQYGILLQNVYDTQVADMMIQRNANQGQMPKYVRNLLVLLVEYLKFTEANAQFYMDRRNLLECDCKVWQQRPATKPILELAALNVRYLIELHHQTQAALMSDFTKGVSIYLQLDRELETKDDEFLVPDEFSNFGHHINSGSSMSMNASSSQNGFVRDRNERRTPRPGTNFRKQPNGNTRRVPHSPANSSISNDRSFERTPQDQSHQKKDVDNREEIDYSDMPELVCIDEPEDEPKSEVEERYERSLQQQQSKFANMTLGNNSQNIERGMNPNRRDKNDQVNSHSNVKNPRKLPLGRGSSPAQLPFAIFPTGMRLDNGSK